MHTGKRAAINTSTVWQRLILLTHTNNVIPVAIATTFNAKSSVPAVSAGKYFNFLCWQTTSNYKEPLQTKDKELKMKEHAISDIYLQHTRSQNMHSQWGWKDIKTKPITANVLRSNLDDTWRLFSLCSSVFGCPDPWAPPPLSRVCFQLWRLCSSKASLGPANAISARKLEHKI